MNYVYSPSENLFYAKDWIENYGDSYPDDAIDVDESVFIEYTSAAPLGKIRIVGKKGMPQWADEPPLTHEQQIDVAESQKQALIAEVTSETEMLRIKHSLKRIKPAELELLNAWLDYLDELEAVDVSTAPDIIWPVKPVA